MCRTPEEVCNNKMQAQGDIIQWICWLYVCVYVAMKGTSCRKQTTHTKRARRKVNSTTEQRWRRRRQQHHRNTWMIIMIVHRPAYPPSNNYNGPSAVTDGIMCVCALIHENICKSYYTHWIWLRQRKLQNAHSNVARWNTFTSAKSSTLSAEYMRMNYAARMQGSLLFVSMQQGRICMEERERERESTKRNEKYDNMTKKWTNRNAKIS